MGEWRQMSKHYLAMMPRAGWLGVWDSLVAASTGRPRKTIPTDMHLSVWVQGDTHVDLRLTDMKVEQSPRTQNM
jgi:hypothetical protein